MAEAGADVHRAVGWPMHEFEGNELIAGELEHGQAGPVAEVNATDLAVPESRVENHGGAKVRDAVRRVQSPHPTTVMQPRGFRGLRPQPWTPPAGARTPRAPRTRECWLPQLRDPHLITIRTSSSVLILLRARPGGGTSADLFAVDDIDDTVDRLRAHGAELLGRGWPSTRASTGSATSAAPQASSSPWPANAALPRAH